MPVKSSRGCPSTSMTWPGPEPAVGQPDTMRLFEHDGQAPDQRKGLLTRFRPVRGHRGRAEPFHGDVGRPVIQPRIEHANHRRMFEPRRQPEPRDHVLPAPGIRPRAAQIANLDLGRSILGHRAIRDPITTRPELGQEVVAVQPHRLPRSVPNSPLNAQNPPPRDSNPSYKMNPPREIAREVQRAARPLVPWRRGPIPLSPGTEASP